MTKYSLIVFASCLIILGCRNKQERLFDAYIQQIGINSPKTTMEVSLSEMVDIEADTLYMFGEYFPYELANEDMGISYLDPDGISSEFSQRILFSKEGEIIGDVEASMTCTLFHINDSTLPGKHIFIIPREKDRFQLKVSPGSLGCEYHATFILE